jgi:Fe2+ transport system protein B
MINFGTSPTNWKLLDYLGRTVLEGELQEKESTIDFSDLAGNYMLIVNNGFESITRRITID